MNKFLKLAYDYGCKQAALDYADLLPLISEGLLKTNNPTNYRLEE